MSDSIFPTKAAAELLVVNNYGEAPEFIETAFYDTNQVDGSGALYKKAAQANLIKDGNFEGLSPEWAFTNGSALAGTYTRSGTYCLYLPKSANQQAYSPFFNVTAGNSYTLGFWRMANTATTVGVYARMAWYDVSDNLISVVEVVPNASAGTSYEFASGAVVAPAGAAKAQAIFFHSTSSAAVSVFVDDVYCHSTSMNIVPLLSIKLSDGVTQVPYVLAGPVVNAASLGLSTSGTATDRREIILQAIAATPVGGTLVIPELGTALTVNTNVTGAALTVGKSINVQIDGHLKMSQASQPTDTTTDPERLFKITADKVRVFGRGKLESPSAYISAPTYPYGSSNPVSEIHRPAILHCTGADFEFSGIRVIKPPSMGLYVSGARALLHDFTMEGGYVGFEMSYIPPAYETANPNYKGSAHFGIVAVGLAQKISNVNFVRGADGGACAQCVMGGTNTEAGERLTVSGCYADRPWEKLFYGYGSNHVIAFNKVDGSYGSTGATSSAHTDAIRIQAGPGTPCTNNLVIGNVTQGTRGGVQILDGDYNKVLYNQFMNCRGVAINVQMYADPDYTDGNVSNDWTIWNNVIQGNTVHRLTSAGESPDAGIRVYAGAGYRAQGIKIIDNLVVAFGKPDETIGAIDVKQKTPQAMYSCDIDRNTIVSCPTGIRAERFYQGSISGNKLRTGGGSVGISLIACADFNVSENIGSAPGTDFLAIDAATSGVAFLNNKCIAAGNIRIRGVTVQGTSGNYGEGNRWTGASLVGWKQLSTSSGVTAITHGGVAPHAIVQIMPTTADGAYKQSQYGYFGEYVSPNNLRIINGGGVADPAANWWGYKIVQ